MKNVEIPVRYNDVAITSGYSNLLFDIDTRYSYQAHHNFYFDLLHTKIDKLLRLFLYKFRPNGITVPVLFKVPT